MRRPSKCDLQLICATVKRTYAYIANPTLHSSNCRKRLWSGGEQIIRNFSRSSTPRASCMSFKKHHLSSYIFEIADFENEQSNFLPWDFGKVRTLEGTVELWHPVLPTVMLMLRIGPFKRAPRLNIRLFSSYVCTPWRISPVSAFSVTIMQCKRKMQLDNHCRSKFKKFQSSIYLSLFSFFFFIL